ncbi:hypothetical protein J5X84_31020 [Streptosporangiaceae bacterium NEAU-GS5]|nr:hypothetical protein [Streptosporangiaceae bacterium NEAU-GS5]
MTSPAAARIPGLGESRTLRIPFDAASGPRSGPLTWAQQHMHLLIQELGPQSQSVNLKFSWPLRATAGEDEVLAALRDTVETFDALRTVTVGDEQRVLRSGELAVPVVEAGAGAVVATAGRVAEAMWAVPFDIAGEWPLRAALVSSGGRLRHLVLAASHLAIDQGGGEWIQHRLRGVLARPPAPVAVPEPVHQPLDEAEWERSPEGAQRGERAIAHHEATYQAMPQTMLPRAAAEVERPRFRYLQYDSAALALAVGALAARHKVGHSAVLYAGICAIAGHVSALDRAFLQLTVGNRIAPRTRYSVGMHTQDVPVSVELGDASIADVIARSGTAITRAARFGQYPPVTLVARRRAIELDRGLSFDLSCWLNYRQAGTRRAAAPVGARTLEEAASRSRWRWIEGLDSSTSTYFVFADDAGDLLRVTLLFDSAVLPPDEAITWLRGVERLLCAAVTTDVGMSEVGKHTDLAQASYGADWLNTDAGWAHLPTVAALLGDAAVVADGRDIVAYLTGEADLPRLHAECVAALPGLRTAVAPTRYVLVAEAPDARTPGAWRAAPVSCSWRPGSAGLP